MGSTRASTVAWAWDDRLPDREANIRREYNDYGESVIEATAHPLFYWFDETKTGVFSMWIDQEGDGCDCHIVPYTAVSRTARAE